MREAMLRKECWCYPFGLVSVPKWYINHVWDAPERLSSRVDCNEAKKEFNAGYVPETEPSTRQHRHCAQWLYW